MMYFHSQLPDTRTFTNSSQHHHAQDPFFFSKPSGPTVSGDILIDAPQRHAGVSASLGSHIGSEEKPA